MAERRAANAGADGLIDGITPRVDEVSQVRVQIRGRCARDGGGVCNREQAKTLMLDELRKLEVSMTARGVVLKGVKR